MKRPWQVWLVFAVCVLGAAGAMGWLTREAVEADRQRRAAQAEAEIEQRVSLAVWRMDTELAPIIAAEVIRPADAFRPPTIASVDAPQYVLLQFGTRPDGSWWSPQSPIGKGATLPRLTELSHATSYQKLLPELPDTPLPTAEAVATRNYSPANGDAVNANNMAANAPSQVSQALQPPLSTTAQLPQNTAQQQEDNGFQFVEGNRGGNNSSNTSRFQPSPQQTANAPNGPGGGPEYQQQAVPQRGTKEADFQQRNKRIQSAAEQGLINSNYRGISNDQQQKQIDLVEPVKGQAKPTTPTAPPMPPAVEQVGVSRPLWVGDRLLLARRVAAAGVTAIQGSWLDWPQIKARLLGEASDLFPKADLVPVNGDATDDPSRMLAGLPVRLVVNESAANVSLGPTLQWALWMGWGGVLAAVLAAAALLQGVMALSERRAAFVSSVTHELRTPLTTFRMYAEMLARGMVPDAARRQEYYETLQKESERLTLLVENVLSYARLERGRKPQVQDRVAVREVLQRVRTRLEQRAAQAGMECVVELNKKTAPVEITTDMAVVEQILFNLVDNAAKYARTATDPRIHVEANHQDKFITFTVRDHGPGIGGQAVERTQPFQKSAQESAESAPGVGLGLALCRRLARIGWAVGCCGSEWGRRGGDAVVAGGVGLLSRRHRRSG